MLRNNGDDQESPSSIKIIARGLNFVLLLRASATEAGPRLHLRESFVF